MSVLKSKRTESVLQFLYTARELEMKTVSRCIHAPKRYTFYGLQEIYKTARYIHSCVKSANSIYPNDEHEFQMRRDFFLYAVTAIQDYISQLEILLENKIFTPEGGEELSKLVNMELKMVNNILKSDRTKYSHIVNNINSN